MTVSYESYEDWRMSSDIVRSQPSFHNRSRFDSVIIHTDDIGVSFDRLVFMFKCAVFEVVYNLALVQYYCPASPNKITPSDKLTGFRRITWVPRRDA